MDTETSHAEIQSQILQTTLAEITSNHVPGAQQAAPDCCVICLEEISEASTAHPCGHSNFDFICVTNWLQVEPKCPLCKAPVRSVRYTDSTGPKTYSVPQKADSSPAIPSSTPSLRTSQTTFQHYFLNYPRRRRQPHTPAPNPSPSAALLRRRHIYTHNLYSLHIGANSLSRYRSGPTPADFTSDPTLISRARTFMRRELQVFSFLASPDPSSSADGGRRRANNAEFLLEYAIAILKTVDMQGASGHAEELLSEFLGRDSARLFLHELRAWLRSPCGSLEAWDRVVQYPDPEGEGSGRKRRSDGEDDGTRREEREPGKRIRGDYWRPSHRRYEKRRREERSVEAR
jgi:hypothetical protein